jgi:hypothetical protein
MTRRERLQLTFTLAVAALGWAAVVAGVALDRPLALPPHGAAGVALFVSVILATRAMAFPIAPGAVLSLDSGFYVAAAVTLGPTVAGLIVALALTADAGVRWWRAGAVDRDRAERRRGLAYVAFFGGATGALVAGVARLVEATTRSRACGRCSAASRGGASRSSRPGRACLPRGRCCRWPRCWRCCSRRASSWRSRSCARRTCW